MSGSTPTRLVIETMEDRILHSADFAPAAFGAGDLATVTEHRLVTSDVPAIASARRELAFVDAASPEANRLVDAWRAAAVAPDELEVVAIGRDEDGIARITQTLAERHDLTRIHLLLDGGQGALRLGTTTLDDAALMSRASAVARWSEALGSEGSIELHVGGPHAVAVEASLASSLSALTGAAVNAPAESPTAATTSSAAQVASLITALPLTFEQNVGQAAATVDFFARGGGYAVALAGGHAVIGLTDGDAGHAVHLNLIGANDAVAGSGEQLLASRSHYLIGTPDQWHRDVANFGAVSYRDVYDGVDLRYYGNQRQLEYDFIVAAGADPDTIRLHFDGAESLSIDVDGNLVLTLDAASGRTLQFQAPVSYQEGPGGREAVSSRYVLDADGTLRFELGAYDHSRTLVIDPVLSYGTYFGAGDGDYATGIAVDASGAVYMTGYQSTDGPLGGLLGGLLGLSDTDAFVTKFNADLSAIVYSTTVGGTGTDVANAIALDAAGNAYVTGTTTSINFATVGAYQSVLRGGQDAFLFKLNAAGSSLVYSTLLGGSDDGDVGRGVAVDANGNAYVTGVTESSDFVTTAGAADRSLASTEAFVTKFGASGSSLVYSTFVGGGGDDEAMALALDGAGNAIVVGKTKSSDFPLSAGAYDTSLENTDAFVTQLNASGSGFLYSTVLGGSSDDVALAVAVDAGGRIYVTGSTDSGNFPVTAGALQTSRGGSTDAFVAVLDPSASGAASLVYSTYLGDSNEEAGQGIAVDALGRIYVTGYTDSSNFPVTANAAQSSRAGDDDAFVVQIDPTASGGAGLLYGTYLGGNNGDQAAAATFASGRLYVAGQTDSSSGIATTGGHDRSYGGDTDAFAAVYTFSTAPMVTATATVQTYVEGEGAKVVDAGLTVIGTNGNLIGATASISANYANGQDILAFDNVNGWGITGTWSAATGMLTLSGSASAASYQAALRSVTYQNSSVTPSTATRSVSFGVSDGLFTSGPASRQIAVTATNNAPTLSLPAAQSSPEGATLTFGTAGSNAISVADADAGAAAIQVSLSVGNGHLSLSQTTGLIFITGTGTNNMAMTFTGSASAINAALDGLRYNPDAFFNGSALLQATVNDQGNTGSGGSLSASGGVTINVTSVNDAPTRSLPGPQVTPQATPLVFSGANGNAISIGDPDAGLGELRVTLAVTNGTATLGSTAGLSLVSGDGSAAVTLQGSLTALNAAFDGLSFQAVANGAARIDLNIDDLGNTGAGGAMQTLGTISITVSADQPPVLTLSQTSIAYTEQSAPVPLDPALTVADADSPNLVSAVVRIGGGYVADADVLAFTDQLGIVGTWNAASGTLTLSGSANAADYQSALRSITYVNASDSPGAARSISLTLSDGIADSASRTLTINVTAVNDAPSVAAPSSVTLNEDGVLTFSAANGNAISVQDVDAGALSVQVNLVATRGTVTLAQTTGLVISAGANGSASLTFSGNVADVDAALNGLSFTAQAGYNGAASLQVSVDDLGNIGSGGAQTASATIAITVTSVNDAPAGTSTTVTTREDAPYVLTAADFGFSDPDDSPANAFVAVVIASPPTAGSLTLNGATVLAGQAITIADIGAGMLRFVPATNAHGPAHASFGFQVRDDGGTANGGSDLDPTVRTLTLDVTPVNDAPAGTSTTVTTLEDTPYVFATADFGFTDPNDGPANAFAGVSIASLPSSGALTLNGSAVLAGDAVSAAGIGAGLLRYAPAAHANGAAYASFSFQVRDNGGTAAGGSDLDPTLRTLTIDVTPVNDAPTGASTTVITPEDTPYVFGVADFGFTDANDGTPHTFASVVIGSLPAAGSLTLNGATVPAGQAVTAADIGAGLLRFVPAANAHGAAHASFGFQVRDDGGTANGGSDRDPIARTLTIDVTPVDDAPVATKNELEITQAGIAKPVIVVTDPDTAAQDIRLQVAEVAGGHFERVGQSTSVLDTFTLADVIAGSVQFVHDGSSTPPRYVLQIYDNANGALRSEGVVLFVQPPGAMTILSQPVVPTPVPVAEGTQIPGVLPAAEPIIAVESTAPGSARAPSSAEPIVAPNPAAASDILVTGAEGGAIDPLSTSRASAFVVDLRTELRRRSSLVSDDDVSLAPAAEEPAPLVSSSIEQLLRSKSVLRHFDELRERLDDVAIERQQAIAISVAMAAGLSAGYIIWLVRGGLLVSSMLSALPAWQMIDPLPILARARDPQRENDDGWQDEDGEGVEHLFNREAGAHEPLSPSARAEAARPATETAP